MNRKCIVWIATAFFVVGCSSTYELHRANSDEFVEKFNAFSTDKTAKITEMTGAQFKAQKLRLSSDSVYWTNLEDDSDNATENYKISRIEFTSHGKGALEGLGSGLLAGALIGATLGFMSGDDPPGFLSYTAAEKAVISGIGLGALGSILGLLGGAISGHKDIFILNVPQNPIPLENAKVEKEIDGIILRASQQPPPLPEEPLRPEEQDHDEQPVDIIP